MADPTPTDLTPVPRPWDRWDHFRDEFGCPLCSCPPCREANKAWNDAYLARVFEPKVDPRPEGQLRWIDEQGA